jgi:hypothetical protein
MREIMTFWIALEEYEQNPPHRGICRMESGNQNSILYLRERRGRRGLTGLGKSSEDLGMHCSRIEGTTI